MERGQITSKVIMWLSVSQEEEDRGLIDSLVLNINRLTNTVNTSEQSINDPNSIWTEIHSPTHKAQKSALQYNSLDNKRILSELSNSNVNTTDLIDRRSGNINDNYKDEDSAQQQLTHCQLSTLFLTTLTSWPLSGFLTTYAAYLIDILGLSLTQIAWLAISKSIGSVVSGIIPTLFDYFEINISFSILLFVTHLFMGTIGIIYSFYYANVFIFFIITQLIFGINRALFSSYRTVFIANMTSSNVKDFNKHNYYYSLIYFATPIGSFLLAFFGILLEDYSFTFALLVFSIPALMSTCLLLIFIPHSAYSYSKSISQAEIDLLSPSPDNSNSGNNTSTSLSTKNTSLVPLIGTSNDRATGIHLNVSNASNASNASNVSNNISNGTGDMVHMHATNEKSATSSSGQTTTLLGGQNDVNNGNKNTKEKFTQLALIESALPTETNTMKFVFGSLKRILFVIIVFLGGLSASTCRIVQSSWIKDYYNVDAANYWLIVVLIAFFEVVGATLTWNVPFDKIFANLAYFCKQWCCCCCCCCCSSISHTNNTFSATRNDAANVGESQALLQGNAYASINQNSIRLNVNGVNQMVNNNSDNATNVNIYDCLLVLVAQIIETVVVTIGWIFITWEGLNYASAVTVLCAIDFGHAMFVVGRTSLGVKLIADNTEIHGNLKSQFQGIVRSSFYVGSIIGYFGAAQIYVKWGMTKIFLGAMIANDCGLIACILLCIKILCR